MAAAVASLDAGALFRAAFCRCDGDARVLLLDVRPHKKYARSHLAGAYNVRGWGWGLGAGRGARPPRPSPALRRRPLPTHPPPPSPSPSQTRVSADGKSLLDASGAEWKPAWSQGLWWDAAVIVYGDAGLACDHPVRRGRGLGGASGAGMVGHTPQPGLPQTRPASLDR